MKSSADSVSLWKPGPTFGNNNSRHRKGPDDRDVLCFLWLENPFDNESPVLQLRFTRLVFGLPHSPAILGTVISHHLGKYQSAHQEFIRDSFYVDDLITWGESIEDAFHIYQVAK